MISKTEIMRKKITRGAILYALYISQAAPMMVSTLELSMLPENPQISGEMIPTVNYLVDRGYIIVTKDADNPSINPLRGALVRITDRGQDVVEGTTDDDGIIFSDGGRG